MAEVSKEYGAALFMLAAENGTEAQILSDLESVESVFNENPGYVEFLASPSIARKERLSALTDAFEGKLCGDVVSFLALLCEKGRIPCFFEATEEYRNLFNMAKAVLNVKVTSAVELTGDEKARLKEKLEKANNKIVNIEYFIDASLLGGMIIETDGKIIDGSIRHRLRDIKEVIST